MTELAAWFSYKSAPKLIIGFMKFKKYLTRVIRMRGDSKYFAIQVSHLLDQYVIGCADVVGDDGLFHGRTDEDGCRQRQTAAPIFEPDRLRVEWMSLPIDVMNDVLSLPFKASQVVNFVNGIAEFSMPPDYSEFFEERQYQYARLGIEAASLANKLRDHANVRSQPFLVSDPVAYMIRRKEEIEQYRRERERIIGSSVL
ncbi:hypothetical protein [Ralstonia solanacearum]|uniref:hypothetical protein n=1 Tax=Ralstonia solanacearum TaxID=305 RepID=UPI000F60C181|nr:hypothetical protein [Ralstonia solanacearum]